jgi:alkanesulfonate monooxygenase SsuD/methylene tetrahydromethanopterin reductase-like flavin-dependent oxidoreductase (luciferase family)
VGTLRFCSYQYQHLPFDQLFERWARAEALGFDALWNVDTVVEPDRPRTMLFDGPTTLAAMALHTSRIRIGTLVTSQLFRSPVLAARAAVAADHLSRGRVEVALGVGDPAAGPAAAGVRAESASEQVARFREFVELIDRLLRNDVTTYEGRYFWCDDAETIPGPIQRPRPPITVAAHGPKMLRVAAEFADGWSSWGGYDVETEDRFLTITKERAERFDDLCVERGRDPTTIRHSLVCFPPLTPWESVEYFRNMVGRFGGIGIDEYVLYWPQHWRSAPHEDAVFEQVAREVMPELRHERSHDYRGAEALRRPTRRRGG